MVPLQEGQWQSAMDMCKVSLAWRHTEERARSKSQLSRPGQRPGKLFGCSSTAISIDIHDQH
eukprot:5848196-Karenia_brevis.AAC.1